MPMTKAIIVGALPKSLRNFRGDLIKSLVNSDIDVIGMAADDQKISNDFLSDYGASYESYPVKRSGLNPFADVCTFFALRRKFKELEPDIILAYTVKPIVWGALASIGVKKVRFFALVTGLGFAFNGQGFARKIIENIVVMLYRLALKRAESVIFQNNDDMRTFVERKIVRREVCEVVNGSGVNLDTFTETPLPKGSPVFLSIGRLLKEKGFREFVGAAQLVKEKYPEVRFHLVGPSDPSPDSIAREELEKWVSSGSIVYHGYAADVRRYIESCHIFVLPSYHEGMPRTVLEALAVGRPILTTDVPGCRETVVQGGNGLLVPKGEVDALAEAMLWFIENQAQWDEMARQSRQLAVEHFDVNIVNSEIIRILKV